MSMTRRIGRTCGLEPVDAELDRSGNGRAPRPADRRLAQFLHEGFRAGLILDEGPIGNDVPGIDPRPFDIGDRNLAHHALADGIQHQRRGERLNIALALQVEFVEIHREGDIDRKHQSHIHIGPVLVKRSEFCAGAGARPAKARKAAVKAMRVKCPVADSQWDIGPLPDRDECRTIPEEVKSPADHIGGSGAPIRPRAAGARSAGPARAARCAAGPAQWAR